ncbi:LapA family protein [Pseudomonas sp. S2_E01]
MSKIKRVTFGALLLLLSAVVIVFMLENSQSSELVFLGWSTPPLPVAVYIVAALLLGGVVGPAIGWVVRSGKKARG